MDIIVDIDGTLADLTHRLHHIRGDGKKNWDAFHDACPNDVPIKTVVAMVREMLATIRVMGFDPVLAIDDRKRVVDMWRSEGIVCAHIADGEF